MSTATIGQNYVPPFAAGRTTLSTALGAIATNTRASQGSAYIPPFGTAGPSATATAAIAYSTDGATDSSSFVDYFVIPYMDAHVLSPPSYRYA
jgi:hypothetical protein